MSAGPHTATAQRLLRMLKDNFALDHELNRTSLDRFPHLDPQRYKTFAAELAVLGFRALADVEDAAANASPMAVIAPTQLRTMLSADGRSVAGYYQVRPHLRRRLALLWQGLCNLRLLDAPASFFKGLRTRHLTSIETELSSGGFIITSSADGAVSIALPPAIDNRVVARDTALEQLVKLHEARVDACLRANAGISVRVVASVEDLMAMQARQRQLKYEYRVATGWISIGELRAMAGGNAQLADELHAEIQRLLQAETAGNMPPFNC